MSNLLHLVKESTCHRPGLWPEFFQLMAEWPWASHITALSILPHLTKMELAFYRRMLIEENTLQMRTTIRYDYILLKHPFSSMISNFSSCPSCISSRQRDLNLGPLINYWLPSFGYLLRSLVKFCIYIHMHILLVLQFSSDFQRGPWLKKRLRTTGLDRVIAGEGCGEGTLFIFVFQYLSHNALYTVEAPKFVAKIHIKMDMCYDGKHPLSK